MRLTGLLLCAAASLIAASRPQYGGTLRIEMRTWTETLDPAAESQPAAHEQACRLLYDRLVEIDERGEARPSLAVEWKREGARWMYKLRAGARFHDGTAIAGSAEWIAGGEPAEMARIARSVVKRDGAKIVGSGPFRVIEWQPGRVLKAGVNESHWAGRAFLDAVELRMGRAVRDQMVDLELGRADVVEVAAGPGRRPARTVSSEVVELIAVRFAPRSDAGLREAFARSLDRASMHAVLVQRQGAAAASLLPQWMTGWSGLFAAGRAAERGPARSMTLAADPMDALARSLVDRIAVNARDAGIAVRQPAAGASADARLVRVRLAAASAGEALAMLARELDLSVPGEGPDAQLAAEAEFMRAGVIPLLHLPETVGLAARVRNWKTLPWGAWRVDEVWLK